MSWGLDGIAKSKDERRSKKDERKMVSDGAILGIKRDGKESRGFRRAKSVGVYNDPDRV